ncbi:MAG: hypothetical protein CBE26_00650 [Kiritimatiellaceae bacterium TMED266]|nr:MAG: hypothetical protein CBE26_00650 [Kiritimatiellaceae bacterium TMED266]
MSVARRTLFFDIDGTLLVARGAGRGAFARSFEEVYGLQIDMSHINFAGATDLGVLNDLLQEHQLADIEAEKHSFFERLAVHLEVAFKKRPPTLFPGVMQFLERVAGHWNMALVTGNTRASSALKLQYSGIDHFFDMTGGYGDDDACRNQMAALAIERAGFPDRGYLLGDTPRDIEAAKVNRLVSVGVCTGSFSREQLALEKPDILVDSLGKAEELLEELCA